MNTISNNTWKNDLSAGLVVFLVALPLCLGIASASTGRPDLLFTGIIAGVVGGVVVGYLSGSQLGVSGPAAGLITIVLSGINKLGTFEAFQLAVVISGMIQIIAGYARAGIIGHYFPNAVIRGMLAGIGITLILKQIPHALGFDKDIMGDLDFAQRDGKNTFSEIYYALKYHSMGAILISLCSLTILLGFDRPQIKKIALFQIIPSSLFVVIAGVIINNLYTSIRPEWVLNGEHLVQLPLFTGVQSLGTFIRFPDFSALSTHTLPVLEVALTLALVASLETLLSVEATDKMDPYKRSTPTNRELKAQGVGNLISGLLGGLPITQVIVRSTANVNSGGKTKKATIIHGLILLISVLLVPKLLNQIPIAALACILLVIGYKLASFGLFRSVYRQGWDQFLPFVVTIVGVVGLDLLKGIALGMIVAIFYILKRNYKNSYHKSITEDGGKKYYHFSLSEEVTFLNKGSIIKTLHSIEPDSVVTIDGSGCVHIDQDVCESIYEFQNHNAPFKSIEVKLIDIPEIAR